MLEIRRCADEADYELSLAIYNEVVPDEAVSREEVRRWETANLAFTDMLAFIDGEPAGSVSAGIAHARPQSARTFLTVLPPMRRRGVGSALYSEISSWARAHGAKDVITRIQEREAESIAFAERRGFLSCVRTRKLVLELGNLELQPGEPALAVEIVRWEDRPELAPGIYEVGLEAHPDVPGSGDWAGEPFEVWQQMHRPELMFVAVADEEVVGFAELFTTSARPAIAVHMMIGVRRSWRGRGVAGALKRAQIAWAKEAGYEELHTENEVRNEPIRRLNEQLGYRERAGSVEMRGPLAEGT